MMKYSILTDSQSSNPFSQTGQLSLHGLCKILGEELDLADVEPCHPAAHHKAVHIDEGSGDLIFPVLFMYPEFGETDFIEAFKETETLSDHIQVLYVQNQIIILVYLPENTYISHQIFD